MLSVHWKYFQELIRFRQNKGFHPFLLRSIEKQVTLFQWIRTRGIEKNDEIDALDVEKKLTERKFTRSYEVKLRRKRYSFCSLFFQIKISWNDVRSVRVRR